jgi:hypothetical protein
LTLRQLPDDIYRSCCKAAQRGRSAVPVVQNLPDLRKHFDEDFKSISDFIKATNVKIE